MGLNVDRTLKAAKKLEALNKLSEAVALYRNILDVYPKNQRDNSAEKGASRSQLPPFATR